MIYVVMIFAQFIITFYILFLPFYCCKVMQMQKSTNAIMGNVRGRRVLSQIVPAKTIVFRVVGHRVLDVFD